MKWLGSTTCDMCNRTIKNVLYDAKIVGGPWATMCHTCWRNYSYGKLRTGLGQKYRENDEHEFIKEK